MRRMPRWVKRMSKQDASGSPLAQLLTYMAGQKAEMGLVQAPMPSVRPANSPEPQHLDYFRELWADVNTSRQLQQSQAHVPEKAGPLNTSHIVHRSLVLARELSPGYLKQFLGHLEALSWMAQIGQDGGALKGAAPAARPATGKRGGTPKGAAAPKR